MARGPRCCCSRSQPLKNVTPWPTRRTSALSMKVRAEHPWGSVQGSWNMWSPSSAPTPCWRHRWQGWSPQPGDLPSFAPPPAPVPQPPTLGTPVPNPPSACSPSPAWQQVEQQLDGSRSGESACGPVQYVEKTPNPGLKSKWEVVLALWGASGSGCNGLLWAQPAPEQGCGGRRRILNVPEGLGLSCCC